MSRFVWPLLLWLRGSGRRAERINRRLAVGVMRLRNSASSDERFVRRQQRAERLYQRRETDLAATTSEAFGWRGGVILSWSGMRGVVTVAARPRSGVVTGGVLAGGHPDARSS